jgi:alpha,alpha-trehalase
MEIYELGQLFKDVQLNNVLSDGKTFPDCLPKQDLATILATYNQAKDAPDFDLKTFVLAHFDLPKTDFDDFKSDPNKTIVEHIESLWDVLTRQPDKAASSLIPLPHPYVVPGGRFREVYYWDSYFTMCGLRVSKRIDLIENMVDNFAYLLRTIGHIPNGNRTYYVGRSQPPFFAAMVELLSKEKGKDVLVKYLPELETEYVFWMKNAPLLRGDENAHSRVVGFSNGLILNRYWDENDTPRPESYKEDVEIAHQSSQKPEIIYRHLRAAAESGWDFSSRWFEKTKDLATIQTTDIIPVDLNCLLYHLESTIAEAYELSNNEERCLVFKSLARRRITMLNKHCWNTRKGFYYDFNYVKNEQTPHETLAAVFPLFFKMATSEQAEKVAIKLEKKFLKTGGLTTTLAKTGQQWDAPNGWSPLQWMAYRGLKNYGLNELADKIKTLWLNTNERIYQKTGKMTEKYDVFNQDLEAGGGEYPLQDGFGWSNGVFWAMTADVDKF